jgi:hypothetical protein
MTYRLHAVDRDQLRLVGEYADYPTALRARIDDVLDQLRNHNAWWTRAEHVIVGPGVDGPDTHHPLCTELGVDPADGRVPNEEDLRDAYAWLLFAHDLAGDVTSK